MFEQAKWSVSVALFWERGGCTFWSFCTSLWSKHVQHWTLVPKISRMNPTHQMAVILGFQSDNILSLNFNALLLWKAFYWNVVAEHFYRKCFFPQDLSVIGLNGNLFFLQSDKGPVHCTHCLWTVNRHNVSRTTGVWSFVLTSKIWLRFLSAFYVTGVIFLYLLKSKMLYLMLIFVFKQRHVFLWVMAFSFELFRFLELLTFTSSFDSLLKISWFKYVLKTSWYLQRNTLKKTCKHGRNYESSPKGLRFWASGRKWQRMLRA